MKTEVSAMLATGLEISKTGGTEAALARGEYRTALRAVTVLQTYSEWAQFAIRPTQEALRWFLSIVEPLDN